MSDLEIDPRVGRMLTKWLQENDPDYNQKWTPTQVLDFSPRPARLGLGAKYVPHRPSVSEADRRLAGALRKQRLDTQRDRLDVEDHTDEVDSLAAIVNKKRGPGRPRKTPHGQVPTTVVANPDIVSSLATGTVSDSDFGRPEHNIVNGSIRNGQADNSLSGEFAKRKRVKIRSRQKNLKKDNRPKDQLPLHLTEETLRGGRVHKESTSNGTGP